MVVSARRSRGRRRSCIGAASFASIPPAAVVVSVSACRRALRRSGAVVSTSEGTVFTEKTSAATNKYRYKSCYSK